MTKSNLPKTLSDRRWHIAKQLGMASDLSIKDGYLSLIQIREGCPKYMHANMGRDVDAFQRQSKFIEKKKFKGEGRRKSTMVFHYRLSKLGKQLFIRLHNIEVKNTQRNPEPSPSTVPSIATINVAPGGEQTDAFTDARTLLAVHRGDIPTAPLIPNSMTEQLNLSQQTMGAVQSINGMVKENDLLRNTLGSMQRQLAAMSETIDILLNPLTDKNDQ